MNPELSIRQQQVLVVLFLFGDISYNHRDSFLTLENMGLIVFLDNKPQLTKQGDRLAEIILNQRIADL